MVEVTGTSWIHLTNALLRPLLRSVGLHQPMARCSARQRGARCGSAANVGIVYYQLQHRRLVPAHVILNNDFLPHFHYPLLHQLANQAVPWPPCQTPPPPEWDSMHEVAPPLPLPPPYPPHLPPPPSTSPPLPPPPYLPPLPSACFARQKARFARRGGQPPHPP